MIFNQQALKSTTNQTNISFYSTNRNSSQKVPFLTLNFMKTAIIKLLNQVERNILLFRPHQLPNLLFQHNNYDRKVKKNLILIRNNTILMEICQLLHLKIKKQRIKKDLLLKIECQNLNFKIQINSGMMRKVSLARKYSIRIIFN